MTPLPLRTVRPFIVDDVALEVAADEEGFELSDKMAITKFLKKKVEELIVRANEQWDERNARAVAEGEDELPRMLPLIRLKVCCFSLHFSISVSIYLIFFVQELRHVEREYIKSFTLP